MNFKNFKLAIQKQFQRMITGAGGKTNTLYKVAIDPDLLWQTYLSSFPPGSNQVFRQRAEHDCSCCRQFVRTMGGVVVIRAGQVITLWDLDGVEGEIDPGYHVVAEKMSRVVRSCPIDNIFLHPEKTIGTDQNRELLEGGEVRTWDHFHLTLPPSAVVAKKDIGTKLGEFRTTHDVLTRALQEIRPDAVETVLELIGQNSLYRGEEHRFVVEEFRKVHREYLRMDRVRDFAPGLYALSMSVALPPSVSRIRNTVIGTLLTDLSEGVDLDQAVAAFESKVAPTNYKRPTALVTKQMIAQAQEKVRELGLEEALERRYARLEDITVNNILFADRRVRKGMKGSTVVLEATSAFSAFSSLSAAVPDRLPSLDKVEEVGVEKFLADVLPRAETLEVFLENRHGGNMVSLVAPRHGQGGRSSAISPSTSTSASTPLSPPSSPRLFKWDNLFSWSYVWDLADSIKERVKKAGGKVEGDLCCRLAWDYTDDLDFHMVEPGGYEIYYPNRRTKSPSGGELDLDANGADGPRVDPAENIYYADRRRMREGVYKLIVNNYHRCSEGKGFEVEVEFDGQIYHMVYEKALRTKEHVVVAHVRYTKAEGFKITQSLPSSQTSKQLWNLTTQSWYPVSVMMLSPNYWDGQQGPQVGNKHYFWMLAGCRNDGQARGFFNEFLRADLDKYRKVLELVGGKMKTPESGEWEGQLSGLGFSSTKRDWVLVRVGGSFKRVVKVVF